SPARFLRTVSRSSLRAEQMRLKSRKTKAMPMATSSSSEPNMVWTSSRSSWLLRCERLQEICYAEIRMSAFAAAEADVCAKNNFSGEKKGKASAKALMQVGEIEIASGEGNFAGVIKNEEANRPDDSAVVLGLNKKRIGSAETKIVKGAERRL